MSPQFLSALQEAANMFAFLAIELTLLFLGVSYLVGVLQEYIPPQKIQNILASKNGKGYVWAAFLGAITPFCSCSTIPFLKGLLRANAGFGTMMVFLFSSPLLNPIIIGLFVVTFGVGVAVYYFSLALVVSVAAGFILERLGFERFVKAQAYVVPSANSCGENEIVLPPINKWQKIWQSTWADFRGALPFLLIGISLGSMIYGFMPSEFISQYASQDNAFAIPVAAVIGIPLYIRAEAVIPLSAALLDKGMDLGAIMALIIGSAGASLTEVILLKSLFKNQMIIAFLVVVLSMAILSGVILNAVS